MSTKIEKLFTERDELRSREDWLRRHTIDWQGWQKLCNRAERVENRICDVLGVRHPIYHERSGYLEKYRPALTHR